MKKQVILSRTEYEGMLKELTELREMVKALQEELNQQAKTKAELEKAKTDLQAELNELKQKPFKKTRQKEKGASKPRGRKKGHEGSGRKKPTRIDRIVRIEAGENCPECGEAFSSTAVERTRDVVDIEPIRPTVNTRYVIERGWCPHCRQYHESAVSEVLPRHRFGLQLMLFVVYQKVALGLSYGKVKKELALYFGLEVSKGQLSNIVLEVSQLFGASYADLLRLMRQQTMLHIDETGWKVNGDNHWLWVFVNEVVTLFVLSKSRGSKVPKAVLGQEFDGAIVTDFFSAYSPLDVEKAKCWAHLLRDSHKLAHGPPTPDPESESVRFHQELHQLFLAMGLALVEADADPARLDDIHQQMKTKLVTFAQQDWTDPDCIRLAKRIRKHLDELLIWLTHPEVAPDNNAAERALRPAVVTRKTSFGSRSKSGAHAFARLLSLIMSWGQQGLDFFTHGEEVLRSSACS